MLSFENAREKFSKQGRDNDDSEKPLTDNSDTSDTEDLDLGQETTLQHNQAPPEILEMPNIQQQGENARLTRRQAQLQGRMYNKETQQFEIPSSSETIEALRRKSKKKIVHRRIKETEDYILVEDVYYQVIPSKPIKQKREESLPDLPSDSDFEESEENKRKLKQGVLKQEEYEFKPPITRPIISPAKLNLPPIPFLPKVESSSPPPPPPPPPSKSNISEQTAKKVDFQPDALVFDFPNERYKKPKSSTKPLDFARQVLKGTADMILPPNPPRTSRTYDDRPVKSAKNYDELMTEFPTGTRPKTRTGPAPPHQMDQTFQYPDAPDEAAETETTEAGTTNEPGPSGATRSHHPQLNQGMP